MPKIKLELNGTTLEVDVPEDMPLLWVLRDKLHLTGTKYSCGIGVCGTCVVLLDGAPVRSCLIRGSSADGKRLTTIEGLDSSGNHPVQRAWNEEDVPQCGYCQGAQVLTAAALLRDNSNPDDDAINEAMSGVLCRCGTYARIRKAIKRAAQYQREEAKNT